MTKEIKEYSSKFWLDICTCRFVAARMRMDNRNCVVHKASAYPCPETGCADYRPIAQPNPPAGFWPKCVCGEIAQMHNEVKP